MKLPCWLKLGHDYVAAPDAPVNVDLGPGYRHHFKSMDIRVCTDCGKRQFFMGENWYTL